MEVDENVFKSLSRSHELSAIGFQDNTYLEKTGCFLAQRKLLVIQETSNPPATSFDLTG